MIPSILFGFLWGGFEDFVALKIQRSPIEYPIVIITVFLRDFLSPCWAVDFQWHDVPPIIEPS
jgi:hypothetical protein